MSGCTDQLLRALSEAVGQALAKNGWRLACAESCTGGWIAAVVTETAGSSAWFDRGFVTYSNESKQEMLGVPGDVIDRWGAVSEETVLAMARGALVHSRAQVSLAVSGIAGPGGASPGKPVGTVCFAWGGPWAGEVPGLSSETRHFPGTREAVRRQAAQHALRGLIHRLTCHNSDQF